MIAILVSSPGVQEEGTWREALLPAPRLLQLDTRQESQALPQALWPPKCWWWPVQGEVPQPGLGQGSGGRGWLPFSDSPPRARGLAILSDAVLRPAGSPFPCWPHAGWQKEGSLKPGLVDDSWRQIWDGGLRGRSNTTGQCSDSPPGAFCTSLTLSS